MYYFGNHKLLFNFCSPTSTLALHFFISFQSTKQVFELTLIISLKVQTTEKKKVSRKQWKKSSEQSFDLDFMTVCQ